MDFWLPVIGVFPALLGGGVALALGIVFPGETMITAVAVLGAQYFCFNLFHLDGLMDSADAFLGTVNREKRLEILKDSRIGVYAFFAGLFVFLLKLGLLESLLRSPCPALLFAWPLSGRTAAALIPVICPPRSDSGLGALAKDSRGLRVAAGAFTALLCWLGLSCGLRALAAALAAPYFAGVFSPAAALPFLAPLAAFPVARAYRRGLGGYTGDALGAAVELGELAHLALAFLLSRSVFSA
jgi:adenosylcobinamide-GDP ribazoletransferase